MEAKNVCPYCGNDRLSVTCRPRWASARCEKCSSNGPIARSIDAAFHAFCHPQHLMEDKVMVDTKMYELTLSMAHKWERICDGEELADVAEGE